MFAKRFSINFAAPILAGKLESGSNRLLSGLIIALEKPAPHTEIER